ncbi:MAG: DUF6345 domain-containing protein [Anaerolineales bacterium]
MSSNHRSIKLFVATLTGSILILLLVFGTQFALAKLPVNATPPTAIPDSPTGWGDDGVLEIGVEWINDFPGTADDRSHWDESCDGLYNQLLSTGWISRFHFTDWSAYETDFKNESLGGSEDAYVDKVDIAMICTHGAGTHDDFWNKNLSSVYFGSSHTDQHLSPGDAYKAYGDKDLEWLAFDSCSVLSDGGAAPYYNRGYWAATMNGLHLLLGFKNTMYVWAPGDGLLWGFYMKGFSWFLPPSTVTQAWFQAVDYVQPTVTCARVLAETPNNFNDYLWGKGYVSPDPVADNYYYYWDHCSTGAKQSIIDNTQPEAITLPRLQVLDRMVNEEYVQNIIAPAFNLTGDIAMDDMFYYMVNTSGGITQTLQVDRVTGSYSFHNLSSLWVTPEMTPTLPTTRVADLIINNWFTQTPAEGLPAAWYRTPLYYFYLTEDIVGEQFMMGENGEFTEQEISRLPANVSMTYPRLISVQAGTADGIQQVEYPVFGPGGRLKLYLGDGGEIIGVQGGSRDVSETKEQIPILDAGVVWNMLMEDNSLAIPELPYAADYITYTAATLGYYELPYLEHQSELIPAWEFTTDFYLDGDLLAEDVPVYVPAAAEYMPPQVAILNPPDGSTFLAGAPILFEGSAFGGTPPYSYAWNSSSDGYLGDTLNIVSALGSEIKGGNVFSPSVSLQVTDAHGLSSTATITLNINPLFWLPAISK